jgi:hypothetical protein
MRNSEGQYTMRKGVMRTDQSECFDPNGHVISCLDTLQDGDLRAGVPWPTPRFLDRAYTVEDRLTGLMWTKDAGITVFPFTWQESLDCVNDMNTNKMYGYNDWRLPNRKEFFSLLSHSHINPALTKGHPFVNVFSGYYWSSTTCCRLPGQAWYIHLGGARVFKGMKHASYMVWPARSAKKGTLQLPHSGQQVCYNPSEKVIQCSGSSQDGDMQMGYSRPDPRFSEHESTVKDNMTNLVWSKNAAFVSEPVTWEEALKVVQTMNSKKYAGYADWRLPNIRELESLTDMGHHSPALFRQHPFQNVQHYYWSSTTSTYDATYAWVVYLEDGSVGVGFKQKSEFFVWAVRSGTISKRFSCH